MLCRVTPSLCLTTEERRGGGGGVRCFTKRGMTLGKWWEMTSRKTTTCALGQLIKSDAVQEVRHSSDTHTDTKREKLSHTDTWETEGRKSESSNIFHWNLTSLVPMMLSYDLHSVVKIPMHTEQHNSSFHWNKQTVISPQEHQQHTGLADSRSEGALDELVGFNYAHFVISGAPVWASSQPEQYLTASPSHKDGLTLSEAGLLVAHISFLDAWPRTAPSTHI